MDTILFNPTTGILIDAGQITMSSGNSLDDLDTRLTVLEQVSVPSLNSLITDTSNILANGSATLVVQASNVLQDQINGFSGSVVSTSNVLQDQIYGLSGSLVSTSNGLQDQIYGLSGSLLSTSNVLQDQINAEVLARAASNVLVETNCSNYTTSTSNILQTQLSNLTWVIPKVSFSLSNGSVYDATFFFLANSNYNSLNTVLNRFTLNKLARLIFYSSNTSNGVITGRTLQMSP